MGWFWYLGTLVPVIGLVQVGRQAMADRYTYIPLIGIFMAIVWMLYEIRFTRKLMPAIAVAAVLASAACSFVQVGYWTNSLTLFRHALTVTQNNDVAHEMLGLALVEHGERAGGERELRTAIDINPANDRALRALGRLRLSAGHSDEAIPLFEKALRVRSDVETRAALAAARGNGVEAIRLYQQAIARDPASTDLHNDFAALLAINGRDQQALEQYQETLRLSPSHYDARMNLGALLSRMGRDAEAIEQFAAAAKDHPRASEPHIYLALAYANSGRISNAIAEVMTAMAINPVESNRQFTDAVRMPFKETNLQEYLAFLRTANR